MRNKRRAAPSVSPPRGGRTTYVVGLGALASKTTNVRKAIGFADCCTLEQLPNIGPALSADLRLIGIQEPAQLGGKDAFVLYQRLCAVTNKRHDPCVLDTFMAATDFMGGAPAAPWWKYTAQRKMLLKDV